MTEISKIALINSENKIVIEALKVASDTYCNDGNTIKMSICERVIAKIEKSLEKER